MNKKLLAVATGAALGFGALAANAAPTVYGSARVALESCTACDDSSTDSWDLIDATSRFGIKGDEDLGGGLKSIYTFEFRTNIDTGTIGSGRQHFVGLQGGFGTVKAGRQFNPSYEYIAGKTDFYNEGTLEAEIGTIFPSRTSDMVYYNSPKLGGFDFGVAVVTAGGADSEDLDQTSFAGRFVAGPFTVAVALDQVEEAADIDNDRMGILLSYNMGPLLVNVAREEQEVGAAGDQTISVIQAQYTAGDSVFRAGYATSETDGATAEPDVLKVEYQYNLSKTTRVWAAYIDADDDDAATEEEGKIQLGMRVDF